MTAGLIAAVPFFAEIENLRECQRLNLRMRVKYPDQNVQLMMPRMRDLKRIVSENGENSEYKYKFKNQNVFDLLFPYFFF